MNQLTHHNSLKMQKINIKMDTKWYKNCRQFFGCKFVIDITDPVVQSKKEAVIIMMMP